MGMRWSFRTILGSWVFKSQTISHGYHMYPPWQKGTGMTNSLFCRESTASQTCIVYKWLRTGRVCSRRLNCSHLTGRHLQSISDISEVRIQRVHTHPATVCSLCYPLAGQTEASIFLYTTLCFFKTVKLLSCSKQRREDLGSEKRATGRFSVECLSVKWVSSKKYESAAHLKVQS